MMDCTMKRLGKECVSWDTLSHVEILPLRSERVIYWDIHNLYSIFLQALSIAHASS